MQISVAPAVLFAPLAAIAQELRQDWYRMLKNKLFEGALGSEAYGRRPGSAPPASELVGSPLSGSGAWPPAHMFLDNSAVGSGVGGSGADVLLVNPSEDR